MNIFFLFKESHRHDTYIIVEKKAGCEKGGLVVLIAFTLRLRAFASSIISMHTLS